ncbi:bone morphogenetic protein 10-like [Mya arenaria]|uniref:bone morphogenetic protein 10-like n=1 Tax=Mya arenaria TaxID=6604 RepID=UPI0022E08258|nr:bone morphogenetic protein 10-like [Mya arenaria]
MQQLFVIFVISSIVFVSVIIARPIMLNIESAHNTILSSALKKAEDKDVKLSDNNGNFHRGGHSNAYGNLSVTPEFMMELYEKMSKSNFLSREADTIRSFKNIPITAREGPSQTPVQRHVNSHVHSLVFDISALDRKERVNRAELRLFTLIRPDRRSYIGVSREVAIYELMDFGASTNSGRELKYIKLTSRYIYNSVDNAWESFDVTDSVKRSVQMGSTLERLEVRIQSVFYDLFNDNMDINSDPNDTRQPVLIVYSTDPSKSHKHRNNRHDFLVHEIASNGGDTASTHLEDEYDEDIYDDDDDNSRNKRSRRRDCARWPMYVNFEDLRMHDMVIAPRGYKAYQCAGRCYVPLNNDATMHAIIQTMMHEEHPREWTSACCVPIKLAPMSLLYYDKRGVVTFKPSFDDMVVEKCACR